MATRCASAVCATQYFWNRGSARLQNNYLIALGRSLFRWAFACGLVGVSNSTKNGPRSSDHACLAVSVRPRVGSLCWRPSQRPFKDRATSVLLSVSATPRLGYLWWRPLVATFADGGKLFKDRRTSILLFRRVLAAFRGDSRQPFLATFASSFVAVENSSKTGPRLGGLCWRPLPVAWSRSCVTHFLSRTTSFWRIFLLTNCDARAHAWCHTWRENSNEAKVKQCRGKGAANSNEAKVKQCRGKGAARAAPTIPVNWNRGLSCGWNYVLIRDQSHQLLYGVDPHGQPEPFHTCPRTGNDGLELLIRDQNQI